MARDVFISYRKEDKASADRICGELERGGIACWMAPRDIPPGREWAAAIVEALKACSSFILVLSSNSKNAKQISREAELADNLGLPIITVRVEDVEPPPELQYFLGNIQWLDAFGANQDAAFERLAGVVRENSKTPVTAKAPPPVEPRPATVPLQRKRGLPPLAIAAIVIVLVAFGIGIWWAVGHKAPAPIQGSETAAAASDNDSAAASAFGVEYLRQRDSGRAQQAYAMTGPAFQQRWTSEAFVAKVEALRSKRAASGYTPAGACIVKKHGAYGCEYDVSYAGGKTKRESLTIAKTSGGWAIASDKRLAEE